MVEKLGCVLTDYSHFAFRIALSDIFVGASSMQVSLEWHGLPAGVKFDPSDVELAEHLAAKCGIGTSNPHILIDGFIPTLEENQGICYTHPENLPGYIACLPKFLCFYLTLLSPMR